MIELFDSEDFAVILGCSFLRWYLGIAYEKDEHCSAVVLRFGPVFLHLMKKKCVN